MHISLLLMDCSFCLRNAEDMRSGMPDMSSSNSTYDCARYEDLDRQPVLKRVNLSECECEICLIGLAIHVEESYLRGPRLYPNMVHRQISGSVQLLRIAFSFPQGCAPTTATTTASAQASARTRGHGADHLE